MVASARITGYELSVSGGSDGMIDTACLRLRRAKVARTEEIINNTLPADYDARGRLIGLEILGPVRLGDLTRMIEQDRRPSLRRFIRRAAPDGLVRV